MSTPNNTYMLTGGSTISSSGFEISVALLPDDLNATKESTTLAQMISQLVQNEVLLQLSETDQNVIKSLTDLNASI